MFSLIARATYLTASSHSYKHILACALCSNSKLQCSNQHIVPPYLLDVSKSYTEILGNLEPNEKQALLILKSRLPYMQAMNYAVPGVEDLTDKDLVDLVIASVAATGAKANVNRLLRKIFQRVHNSKQSGKASSKSSSCVDCKTDKSLLLEKKKKPGFATIMLPVSSDMLRKAYDYKQMRALQVGHPVVIDASFSKMLDLRDSMSTGNQIAHAVSLNKYFRDPFHIHLTGLDSMSTPFFHSLLSFMGFLPNRADETGSNIDTVQGIQRFYNSVKFSVSEKCFTELFPHKQLVYLSPEGRTPLTNFNHNNIYIIGGLSTNEKHVSRVHAQKLNIPCKSFSLKRRFPSYRGPENLHIEGVLKLLNSLREGKDWSHSLTLLR